MASSRSDVRPSCRKKIRWPSPHRGAVRNSSPLAFPWVMLSASLGPMLCSNKSENRLARFPRSAGLDTFPVGRDGVWHNAQPISLNNLLPLMVDGDRKSTRLNSSHGYISYAVFCLKKKRGLLVHS